MTKDEAVDLAMKIAEKILEENLIDKQSRDGYYYRKGAMDAAYKILSMKIKGEKSGK